MKKTPIILMSTALLSVPCAEGAAKKTTTTNSPTIKTALMRYIHSGPSLEIYYSMVEEHASSSYSGEITGELYFINDLNYDSLGFTELIQDIATKFFDEQLDLTTSDFILSQDLKVGDVWDAILNVWSECNGEIIE